MSDQTQTKGNRPDYIAKIRHGSGDDAKYERIGVGWSTRQGDGVFVKLHGTQVVSEFVLYENSAPSEDSESEG